MDDETQIEKFFLNTKPVRLLIGVHRPDFSNYSSALASEMDVTYSHTVKVLQKMKDFGLVEFSKKGRKKKVKLTEDGETIASRLDDLCKTLDAQLDN